MRAVAIPRDDLKTLDRLDVADDVVERFRPVLQGQVRPRRTRQARVVARTFSTLWQFESGPAREGQGGR